MIQKMVTVRAKKNKLKELLTKRADFSYSGVGEKISPSIKRARLGYEQKGKTADTHRKNVVSVRENVREKARIHKGQLEHTREIRSAVRDKRAPRSAFDIGAKPPTKEHLRAQNKHLIKTRERLQQARNKQERITKVAKRFNMKKKNKLKELLAKRADFSYSGVGEKISPSIKRARLGYEQKGAEADKKRVNVLKERKERSKNKLTSTEKSKLFKGLPVNAFKRFQQVKDIVKNR